MTSQVVCWDVSETKNFWMNLPKTFDGQNSTSSMQLSIVYRSVAFALPLSIAVINIPDASSANYLRPVGSELFLYLYETDPTTKEGMSRGGLSRVWP